MAKNMWNPGGVMGDAASSMTAAGTTTGTAATMTADHIKVTVVTSSADGVIMRAANAGEVFSVSNADTVEPLKWYPPSGGSFNGRTADLPAVVPSGKAAIAICIDATNFNVVIGN